MTTPADVLAIAASKIGVGDNGSNVNEFTAWYGMNGPWCAMFVSWCFVQAGLNLGPGPKGFAWCPGGQAMFKAKGAWHDGAAGAQPGDVVFWEMGTASGTDHVEIVERLEPDGRITTIGGNVGNKVGRFTRSTATVVGYGRPAYDGASTGAQSAGGATTVGLDALNPLGSVTDALGAVSKFIGLATDPGTVRRILYLGAGLGLIIGGSVLVNRDAIAGTAKTVGSAVAAAYTGGASAVAQGASKASTAAKVAAS